MDENVLTQTYVVVDVETTGKGIRGTRITEICAVRIENGKAVNKFTSLVNPEAHIPPFITGLTGIDNEMVDGAPLFSEIASEVADITADAIFVAHNVNFDYNVLRSEFQRLSQSFVRKKLCTVRLSRKLIPGLFSYSLGNLCASINIPLNNRHRAEGDTDATVILFQRILSLDQDGSTILSFLNSRSKEATLPPHLPARTIEELPETAGIYLFKDQKGKIIYVGKAINIKKRVLSHFYEKKNSEYHLAQETHCIEYEVTGNELCALLLESERIKQHFPKFNRAQKIPVHTYTIISYTNRLGILQLAVTKSKYKGHAIDTFQNRAAATDQLMSLCEAFDLCARYCSLQQTSAGCDHYKLKDCRGVCRGQETVASYNRRVKKAIASLQQQQASYIIQEKGRTHDESAFVLVQDGLLQGFGFVSQGIAIDQPDDLEPFIQRQSHSYHTEVILKSYFKKNKNIKRFDLVTQL
ncbi:MAG: DNA polymerase III subunit epsilon [Cytophagaceae bacterium]|nr:DNA polymerase III subunit epsilon [Cytophagaceae bacterium]